MYKYRTETKNGSTVSRKPVGSEDYLAFRLSSLPNALQFETTEFSYVSDCYGYINAAFYDSGDSLLISDGKTVFEYFGNENFAGKEEEIYGMKPLSGESEKIVFGQLYFTSEQTAEKFKTAEIYMNNALD